MTSKSKNSLFIFLIFFIFSLFSSFSSFAYTKDKIYAITILHVNDTHGEFWPDKDGNYGFAAMKSKLDQIRQEVDQKGGMVLFLHAGDLNTGNPYSDLLKAKPDIIAFNEMKLDALTMGNHEFDLFPRQWMEQKKMARFPFLAANLYYVKNKKRVLSPYIKKNFQDLKITIFGLTTEWTQGKTKTEDFFFKPVIDEAKTLLPTLRKESDIVIGLTHIGHFENGNNGNYPPGDENLARAVAGIDILVGGHSHTPLDPPVIDSGTIIAQVAPKGTMLGRLDLEFKNGKIILKEHQLISLAGVKEDESLKKKMAIFHAQGEKLLATEIGEFDADFYGRDAKQSAESNLGRLTTKGMMEAVAADFSLISDRALRETIKKGKVTYESVLRVFPFDNTVCTIKMNEDEIKEYLTKIPDSFLHAYGMEIKMKEKKVVSLLFKGKPLVQNKLYTVAISSHHAEGGSGWPDMRKHPHYLDSGILVNASLKQIIEREKTIKNANYSKVWFVVEK